MHQWLDTPAPVRQGEELDSTRLQRYLMGVLPDASGPLAVQQFPSGFSNLTYSLRLGDRDLVLRRPPVGSKVKAAHDMRREFTVLSALSPHYAAAPKPVAYCDDQEVIGAPFYVMERISGVVLRGKKPDGFACSAGKVRACCESLVAGLAQLHALDYEAIGLGALRREGSFVERNVHGWIDRYYGSQTDEIPAIDQTAEWLKRNCPPDVDAVLIHNDYKFDNIVLDPEDLARIIGVLDWEMCTIGDPLVDLGVSLSYWVESEDPALGVIPCFLTREPGSMTRLEVAQRYAEHTGRSLDNLVFYYVFGVLKLAVIAQQIYYRYHQGLTKDARFAPLIFMVGALGMKALGAIESGKV